MYFFWGGERSGNKEWHGWQPCLMTEARWRAVIAFSLLAIMPCMMTFSKNLGSGGFISGFLFCVTRPGVILVANGEVNEAGLKGGGIWLYGIGVVLLMRCFMWCLWLCYEKEHDYH